MLIHREALSVIAFLDTPGRGVRPTSTNACQTPARIRAHVWTRWGRSDASVCQASVYKQPIITMVMWSNSVLYWQQSLILLGQKMYSHDIMYPEL